jgi:hypothetical protein
MSEKTPEETTDVQDEVPPKPKAHWEYKSEFGIHARMREVIEMTIKVTTIEIDGYRRKIERLTYGS